MATDRVPWAVCSNLVVLWALVAQSALAGEFKVTRGIRGDTFQAEGCDVKINIRLMAIDAPEIAHQTVAGLSWNGSEHSPLERP